MGQRGIQRGGAHADLPEGLDLVPHQGDEGRHHHPDAGPADGRDLVAERFSAAGRHQDQGVAPRKDVADDLGLPAAKGFKTENVAEDLFGWVWHAHDHTRRPAWQSRPREGREGVERRDFELSGGIRPAAPEGGIMERRQD